MGKAVERTETRKRNGSIKNWKERAQNDRKKGKIISSDYASDKIP